MSSVGNSSSAKTPNPTSGSAFSPTSAPAPNPIPRPTSTSAHPSSSPASTSISAQHLHHAHASSTPLGHVESTQSALRIGAHPLISVIVPVYNVAKLLERCVNSILDQSYHYLEIILVDDGSTDMSGKFCDIFAKKDQRIKVFHQKNQGLSAARNTGLQHATGEFVTLVDSDDSISPDMLQFLLAAFQNPSKNLTPIDISCCSFMTVSSDGRRQPLLTPPKSQTEEPHQSPTKEHHQPQTEDPRQSQNPKNSQNSKNHQTSTVKSTDAPNAFQLFSPVDCLVSMLCEADLTLSACGKLYRRSLFQGVEFPVGKLYEDVGTTYRLISQSNQVAVSTAPKYYYYQNTSSIIHQTFTKSKLDLITLTDQMCDDLTQKYLTPTPSHHTSEPNNLTPDVTNLAPASENLTQLQLALNLRRTHARFSVLRQMVMLKSRDFDPTKVGLTKREYRKTRRQIVRYLRKHRRWVLQNPLAARRDRLAMYALLLGLPIFKFAWHHYAKNRN